MWVKLLSAIYMIFLCLRNSYDAIYVRELETNPGPRLLSRIFKIPLYIEINDLIVATLEENGGASYLVKRVRKHQKLDFKQAKGIIIPSVQRRNWIINQYNMSSDRVHLVMNGTDVYKQNIADSVTAKKSLGLSPKSFCLGFLGTIYERYDFNSIFRVILECQNLISELTLIIIGDGPSRPKIAEEVTKLSLDKKTIFTGYIEPEKLGRIMPALDLGLMILTKEHVVSAGPVHTKLATYAMYSLPVVTAGFSLKGYPEELIQGLYLVPPENSCAIADQILHIHKNPKESSKKAKILHDYAIRKLTWNAVTRKIIDIMQHDITV
jgi:glycosyltransferase involved in cell wall biosynthesis